MTNRLFRLLRVLLPAVLGAGLAAPAAADSGGVARFATLPAGPGFPEGIAADAAGKVYVATFDFSAPNAIHVFAPSGRLEASIPLPGVLPLGLAFDAAGDLFVADFGAGRVLRFAPPFTPGSAPAAAYAVCGGAGAGCGLNSLAFDASGALYISDSFGGNIFRLDPGTGAVATFLSDDLLRPGSHGFPPFGANGLAFDAAGALYIANTADDRILKYDPESGTLASFAESVNGADGLAFDSRGRLWVAANQADEIVALDTHGRVVERRGAFEGIGQDGAAKGLLFPASLALSGGSFYVTNLALSLTPALGDEPEEDVRVYTVSRIPLGR